MKQISLLITILFSISFSSCAQDKNPVNKNHSYEIIVPELQNPWGFEFLPDGSMLINEKSGRMIHYKNGKKSIISGLPKIEVLGQGGLMDIKLHPNYKNNGWFYITYAASNDTNKGANTSIMRAKLEGNKLSNQEVLYTATPNTTAGQHFGSRIAFDANNHLYFSIGDRGERDVNPQDLSRDGGKIYRLNDDGSIPKDNPFLNNPNAKKAIFSYGHRNPQGMVIHPETGEIWSHEHGPKGGDEINIIQSGKNYGWPLVTYGINYYGTKISDKTRMPGTQQPIYYWDPSIAPSGMAFITSDIYPNWKGNLLIGSLKFQYLNRCVIKKNKVIKEERLLDKIGRVRSIRQGPNGYIYVGVENVGIVKIIPKN
ncbi:PQQ-dependent sugar dehydrogenase [Oceanihabitans sediminis]|uniref:PQQ-dependent sugar dehydrogenase n=1 Tax=Oceanihabitans sediminis TaxID=1812012 RepID=UPI00299DE8FC|nr:PQQ-dependent sugar dehydrogenase [Oceanihabitans sediminis]MDX1277388.1 PQQ-dependent sugar dehydrogenase [Oceanihabitans sediminis]